MSERSTRLLLALSLALNILILGAAAGAGAMWIWGYQPRSGPVPRGLQLAAENLSAERQQTFRKMLAAARREVRSDIDAGRSSRDELSRLLVQDQLDPAAVDAELVKIRNADAVLRSRLEQAVVSFAETLSPAERALFVEGLRGRAVMLRRIAPRKN